MGSTQDDLSLSAADFKSYTDKEDLEEEASV